MLFDRARLDAGLLQLENHIGVAVTRGRFVIATPVDSLHAEFARELRDEVTSAAMQYPQTATLLAERLVQFRDRAVDKGHPPVSAIFQGVKDLGVEDEHAMHLGGIGQRVVQRGVVVVAQVAAEPDQGGVSDGHGQRTPGCRPRR